MYATYHKRPIPDLSSTRNQTADKKARSPINIIAPLTNSTSTTNDPITPTSSNTTTSKPINTTSPTTTSGSRRAPSNQPVSTEPTSASIPLKKRKLDESISVSNPSSSPTLSTPNPTTSQNKKFASAGTPHTNTSSVQKSPKTWLMEWCQKKKVTPTFTRETTTITSPSSPHSVNFRVTLHIPPPYNRNFISTGLSHTARDAENSVCKIALHHLDRDSFDWMEVPDAKVAKLSPSTPTDPEGLPADVIQEQSQPYATPVALPPKAVENPVSFLKEVSLYPPFTALSSRLSFLHQTLCSPFSPPSITSILLLSSAV